MSREGDGFRTLFNHFTLNNQFYNVPLIRRDGVNNLPGDLYFFPKGNWKTASPKNRIHPKENTVKTLGVGVNQHFIYFLRKVLIVLYSTFRVQPSTNLLKVASHMCSFANTHCCGCFLCVGEDMGSAKHLFPGTLCFGGGYVPKKNPSYTN